MKKLSALVLLACLIFGLPAAQAGIDDSKIALGGIAPADKTSKVISIYGQPDDRELLKSFRYIAYGKPTSNVIFGLYPETVGIGISGQETVISIEVNSNNGFATPDGVKVGTPESVLYEKYGKPDSVSVNEHALIYQKSICYKGFLYKIVFYTHNDGKICCIRAELQNDYFEKKRKMNR